MEELENTETKEEKQRANLLRNMRVCRFCLDEAGPFTNIYEKDAAKQSVPLPVQIMACVAIEVFANDSMPKWICNHCKEQTNQAYSFKSICKRTDDALKLYLATGSFVKPLRAARTEGIKAGVKRAAVTPPSQPSKTIKIDSGKTVQPTPVQITEDDVHEDVHVEKGASASESILGMADEEISQQESESQLEFHDLEQEESDVNPVLKVPQVNTDVFPCPDCERSFPLQQLLDLHKAIHERERSFSCDQCHRKFFTKYDLGKHLQTHTDTKPYTCVVCDKQFARESLLHRHEKIHVNAPKYLCPQCDRTFLTKEDVEAHAQKHNKKRPYTCGVCGKGFVFKQGLERHEATHITEKPHKCNYCEASFASPIKLTRHITSHAGLRPYPCKRCGRTFLLSHHLTRHMRTHIAANSSSIIVPVGEYKCDVCSMSFKRKDSLINHSAIHSMVNLRCVICNTEFETAQKVKEHITTHLSSLPYPCEKCDYSFETQSQLEEHEMKHAEMEYEEQIEKEVTAEELQKRAASEEGDCDDDDDQYLVDDDIAEFTITSDLDNPEVVRRSKRESKIKNYAEFLKEELGSDVEDIQDDDDTSQDVTPTKAVVPDEDPIKPIVRTEGTKVYSRKSNTNKAKPIILNATLEQKETNLEQINEPQSLANFNYTDEAIEALGNKQFVDMKIGGKLLRVQKMVVSEAEIQAMAKEGRLNSKPGTIILKKMVRTVKPPTGQSQANDGSKIVQKPLVKKTYQRVKDIKEILQEAVDDEPSTSTFTATEGGEEIQEIS